MRSDHRSALASREPEAKLRGAAPKRALGAGVDKRTAPDLAAIVAELRDVRDQWRISQRRARDIGGRELPSREALTAIVDGLRGALFPMRLGPPDLRQEGEDYYVGHTLDTVLSALLSQVRLELRYHARHESEAIVDTDARSLEVVRVFGASLPGIRALLDSDVLAAFHGDPAARSVDEVLLCYPGIHAMIHHRIAHELYALGVPLLARLVAELAHGATGIDIHPGATIGPGFFIDHGTGVVIGETALIGRNVRLYQAVTLGAKRFATEGRRTASDRRGRSRDLCWRHDPRPRDDRARLNHRWQRLADAQRAGVQPHRPSQHTRRQHDRRLDDPRHVGGMSEVCDRFAAVVRQLRESRGWSQERLANRAQLNRSYMGEIERATAMPSLATADKLASALEVPLSDLISRCEVSNPA